MQTTLQATQRNQAGIQGIAGVIQPMPNISEIFTPITPDNSENNS
jgi:hypothetical protein